MNEPRNGEEWQNPRQLERCSKIPDLVYYFLSFVFFIRSTPRAAPPEVPFCPPKLTLEGAIPKPTQSCQPSRPHTEAFPGRLTTW